MAIVDCGTTLLQGLSLSEIGAIFTNHKCRNYLNELYGRQYFVKRSYWPRNRLKQKSGPILMSRAPTFEWRAQTMTHFRETLLVFATLPVTLSWSPDDIVSSFPVIESDAQVRAMFKGCVSLSLVVGGPVTDMLFIFFNKNAKIPYCEGWSRTVALDFVVNDGAQRFDILVQADLWKIHEWFSGFARSRVKYESAKVVERNGIGYYEPAPAEHCATHAFYQSRKGQLLGGVVVKI